MRIGQADQADILEIMALIKSAIKKMQADGIDQWDEIYPDSKTIENDVSAQTLFIAKDRQKIAGIVVLNEHQEREYKSVLWKYDSGNFMVMHRLCVAPEYRNKGIGRLMVDFAEAYARKNNYQAIRLDAFSKNPTAIRLYEKSGYGRAGEVVFRKGLFYCYEKKTA